MEEDTGRGLEIEQRWAGSTTLVVEFGGHLDSKTITRVALCANDICSTAARNVRIDLGGLLSVDDAGLLILAAFCRIVQRNGCVLLLLGPRSVVQDLLRRIVLAAEEEDGLPLRVEFIDEYADGPAPLSAAQSQELELMERELARDEPGLAAMFAAFGGRRM